MKVSFKNVSFKYDEDSIVLNVDIRNGSNAICLNGRTIEICQIVTIIGDEDVYSVAEEFCGKMCDAPRTANKIIYGGNDWYCNYGNNSYDKIIHM